MLPPLCGQGEHVISPSNGNFELRGTLTNSPATLRFRVKSGLGYRLALSGPTIGRLDDPGRRPGVLARPNSSATKPTIFRLIANGTRLQLELNGAPAWDYAEKETGIASMGAVSLSGPVRNLEFRALPPTPPAFAERYGPAIGELAPPLTAADQSGKLHNFASLRGPKGLWVLFIRSADW